MVSAHFTGEMISRRRPIAGARIDSCYGLVFDVRDETDDLSDEIESSSCRIPDSADSSSTHCSIEE